MLHLANDNIDNEMLKTMWLNALREDMRKILSASDSPTTSVERLAASADSIQDASERGTIASVNNSDLMVKAIEMLTKRIEVMETRRFPHHRSRSHSRVVVRRIGRLLDHSTCWFHRNYGVDARRWRSPCRYDKKPSKSGGQRTSRLAC